MAFTQIPADNRVPGAYGEFNKSGAVTGPSIRPKRALLVGTMLSGTATAGTAYPITSEDIGATRFGSGSQIDAMCLAFRRKNRTTELWAVGLAEPGASVASTATITASGTSTAAGTVNVRINGI